MPYSGSGDDGTSTEDRTLDDRGTQIVVPGSRRQNVARAEGGPPERDASRIEFGPGAGESQCGVDIFGVATLAHQLARSTARFAEVTKIEGHHGEAGLCEPLLVLPSIISCVAPPPWTRTTAGCGPGRSGSVSHAAHSSVPDGNVVRIVMRLSV